MLKITCVLLIFFGCCTMSAAIFVYRNTLKTFASYLTPRKGLALNLHTSIMIMMLFFLLGYIATFFYISGLDTVHMSLFLIAVIFFFGAIFCYSVVFVQSDLLNRLEQNANELRKAFEESKTANVSLESLNHELVATMDALKSTQSRLIFSEKMSALGELMAGISHEINTPICAVKASAQSLNDSLSLLFSELLPEIRQLSDADFQHYVHYTKIAVRNTRQWTTTSELRALKRKARQTLAEADGLNDGGSNDELLETLARASLLDSETVISLIPLLATGTFDRVLNLISRTVSIIVSVDNITVSAEKVIKMVSSLKSFAHYDANSEKSVFNIITGIETVLSIYINQLKYDVEVVTDFESVPDIAGYEDELSQVWSNLIQNAIYAMRDGSTVPQEEHRPGRLIICVKNTDDDHVAVSVTDNAGGISTDKAEKIFEPFYTTKPTGIGTGLGLSISKQIVEKHGGTIRLDSAEGCGTTFTVTLPT